MPHAALFDKGHPKTAQATHNSPIKYLQFWQVSKAPLIAVTSGLIIQRQSPQNTRKMANTLPPSPQI